MKRANTDIKTRNLPMLFMSPLPFWNEGVTLE
jgi:hypothetical protein